MDLGKLTDGSLRVVDSCLLAGIVVACGDCLASIRAGGVLLSGQLFVLSVVLSCSVFASLLTAGVSLGLGTIAPFFRTRRWIASLPAGLLMALPLLHAAPRLALRPGLPLAMVLVGALGAAGTAGWIVWRHSSPIAALPAALVSSSMLSAGAGSLNLAGRIDTVLPGPFLLVFLAASAGALLLLHAIACLLTSDRRAKLPSVLLFVVAGVVVIGGGLTMYTGSYATMRRLALVAGFLLLASGILSLLRRAVTWRVRAPAMGVPVAALLLLNCLLPGLSPARWVVASHAVAARLVVEETGLFEHAFSGILRELEYLPEALDGARSAQRAVAWNREARAAPYQGRKWSVLLITIDAFRYDHAGYSGLARHGLTPVLDRLAASSYRFHNCYAQGGWTSISVPSLLYSMHPRQIKFVRLLEDDKLRLFFEDEVPEEATILQIFQSPVRETAANLPGVLALAGYQSVAVPNDGGTHYFDPRLGFTRGFTRTVYPRAAVLGDGSALGQVDDEDAVALALGELQAVTAVPFLFWVHLFGPHRPKRMATGVEGLTPYAAAVGEADRHVGRILEVLDEEALADRTVIVVTSDHGESLGERGQYHHGLNLYEESVRVPLLVHIPGDEAGDVSEDVGLIDIAPTLLNVVGAEVPETMHGFSLLPLLHQGREVDRPPVLMETWRYDLGSGDKDIHQVAIVDDRLKVILDFLSMSLAFYDLAADPSETTNLLGSNDEALRARFLKLAAYLVGAFPPVDVNPIQQH